MACGPIFDPRRACAGLLRVDQRRNRKRNRASPPPYRRQLRAICSSRGFVQLFSLRRNVPRRTFPRGGAGLLRERFFGSSRMTFPLQCLKHGLRPFTRDFLYTASFPFFEIAFRLLARFVGNRAFSRRRQLHARATRLRKTDGDCLFRRTRAVLTSPNSLDFFADKLTGLGRGCLAFALVPACAFECLLFRHRKRGSSQRRTVAIKMRLSGTKRAPNGRPPRRGNVRASARADTIAAAWGKLSACSRSNSHFMVI